MCDDSAVRRTLPVPTSFFIEDIIFADDRPHSADHRAVVVRPWEKQGGTETTWLTAAAYVTLYNWQQAINSTATTVPVSPLCALYEMTNNNFVHALNADSLRGWDMGSGK